MPPALAHHLLVDDTTEFTQQGRKPESWKGLVLLFHNNLLWRTDQGPMRSRPWLQACPPTSHQAPPLSAPITYHTGYQPPAHEAWGPYPHLHNRWWIIHLLPSSVQLNSLGPAGGCRDPSSQPAKYTLLHEAHVRQQILVWLAYYCCVKISVYLDVLCVLKINSANVFLCML